MKRLEYRYITLQGKYVSHNMNLRDCIEVGQEEIDHYLFIQKMPRNLIFFVLFLEIKKKESLCSSNIRMKMKFCSDKVIYIMNLDKFIDN